MMFGKDDIQKKGVETVIGPTVKVDGRFSGKGNVVVQGQVAGSMRTSGDVQIDQGAIVKASVEASNVTVAGEVYGNIKAQERLEMTETARVNGDVEAKTVSIGAGAVLNGKCTMTAPVVGQEAESARAITSAKQPKGNRRAELAV